MTGRVLVAGVGNIFLGDDGFGGEVVKRLKQMELPDYVRLADYGISGMHLAYDLAADGYDVTILIDAAPRGAEPGTVTVVEVDPEEHKAPPEPMEGSQLFNAHGMQPDVVFGVLDMLGAKAGRIYVVGCEPASIDYRMELSEPVAAAVGEAARIVMDMIAPAEKG